MLVVLLGPVFVLGGQKKSPDEEYGKWLDEEVAYIITPVEKNVFLKLQTDRDRAMFREAFWKQRDPTKGTPENEFKTEHYRRINYANFNFGRSSPAPGWKTDRGRIYILLGEPKDIQRLDGKSQIYPSEIWFYQGLTDLGLPPGFNLVFFKRSGIGDYELYSPLNDGPMALLKGYQGDPLDYSSAYQRVREADPVLALASMSLIPGEQGGLVGRPSLSSDLLIQRVETTAERQVEERYARKFLEYKDIVEVEYSTNYIGSDALVKVSRHPSGTHLVHYALEPDRLSVNQYRDKYHTNLQLNGTVTALDGTLIYQYERDILLELNEDQAKSISSRPISIRDVFPIIPGRFRVSILLKNEISKEFTSIEQELYIPGDSEGVVMTSPLLGYKITTHVDEDLRIRPFQWGRSQIYAQAGRVFLQADSLVVALQLQGLNRGDIDRGELIFRIMCGDEEFKTITRKTSDYASPSAIMESIPLTDFPSAHYALEVALQLDGQDVVKAQDEFDVTFAEGLPRPWFYNKLWPETSNPVYLFTLGKQYFNQGKISESKALLEKAHLALPKSAEVRVALAGIYQETGDWLSVERLVKPLFLTPKEPEYEAYLLLSKANRQLGRWAEAIDILNPAVIKFGLNPILLNDLGESYLGLGDRIKAADAWERSLKLDPDQREIRQRLSLLKEKR